MKTTSESFVWQTPPESPGHRDPLREVPGLRSESLPQRLPAAPGQGGVVCDDGALARICLHSGLRRV